MQVIKAASQRKTIKSKRNKIPEDILNDERLSIAISALPPNYNFEIKKCVWKARCYGAKCIALQFPEGLLMYACIISDILEEFSECESTMILADVAYGACCIDDYSAKILGADFLIHFGHSCLISINVTTGIKLLYVFVDIQYDTQHFVDSILHNFSQDDQDKKFAISSTIQFASSLPTVSSELLKRGISSYIPREMPLSPGEVLGCTAPKLDRDTTKALIFIADGRFHLEALMISNPSIPAYLYDPYSKTLTKETYDYSLMMKNRFSVIEKCRNAKTFGIILSTLGRQGSSHVLDYICGRLEKLNKTYVIVLISEISPQKLKLFDNDIDAWIQIACPRLSIDWGLEFDRPFLTPYEAGVVLNEIDWKADYPMDFYSNKSLGPWTPNNKFHINISKE